MSVEIYRATLDYEQARDEAIRIGEASDRAFARVMRGEVRTTSAASRLAARFEEAESEAYQAALALVRVGVDPNEVDARTGRSLRSWNSEAMGLEVAR